MEIAKRKRSYRKLNDLADRQEPQFWDLLLEETQKTEEIQSLLRLSDVRKRANTLAIPFTKKRRQAIRLAIIGGYDLYPLSELIEHYLQVSGFSPKLFVGEANHYFEEILEEKSRLYSFKPQIIFLLPSQKACHYQGQVSDPVEKQRFAAIKTGHEILQLCQTLHARSQAEVILSNFPQSYLSELGPYRSKTLGSDWNFRKLVNLEIGLQAPEFLHICDVEFLLSRRGSLTTKMSSGPLDSNQIAGETLMIDIAKEVCHITKQLRSRNKRLLLLDEEILGLEPEGTGSSLDRYLLGLTQRGISLALFGKRDLLAKSSDRLLKKEAFAALQFGDHSLQKITADICKELEIPTEQTVLITQRTPDPSLQKLYPQLIVLKCKTDPNGVLATLQESRYFETLELGKEEPRKAPVVELAPEPNQESLEAYLESLNMEAVFEPLKTVSLDKLSHWAQKYPQLDLAARKRSEADLKRFAEAPLQASFLVRLSEKGTDLGIVALVLGSIEAHTFEIDSLVLSSKGVQRQLEEEILNEIMRIARRCGCHKISATYVPAAENSGMKDLFPRLGFQMVHQSQKQIDFYGPVKSADPFKTKIRIKTPSSPKVSEPPKA